MNCTKCGNPLETGAAYCGNCGQPVVPTQPVASSNASTEASAAAVATPTSEPINPLPATASPTAENAPTLVQTSPTTQPQPAPNSVVPAYAVPPASVSDKRTVIGLVCGIVSIPACILPIAGIITSITAIVLGAKTMKTKDGKATAALVLGIVGLILAVIVYGINVNEILKKG